MDDIYKNILKYNSNKKHRISVAFDYILSNKKLNLIVTELFIRGRKVNIYLGFILQSHFGVPKSITLKSTNYIFIKIPNKQQKYQQIAFNHSSCIDFQDFINLYKTVLQNNICL